MKKKLTLKTLQYKVAIKTVILLCESAVIKTAVYRRNRDHHL